MSERSISISPVSLEFCNEPAKRRAYNPPVNFDTELRNHVKLLMVAQEESLLREQAEKLRHIRADFAGRGMAASGGALAAQARTIGQGTALRIERRVDVYLDTFSKFGVELSHPLFQELEAEIRRIAENRFQMSMLPSVGLTLPPGVLPSLEGECKRFADAGVLPALNRLREYQLLQRRPAKQDIQSGGQSYTASGPNARIVINSTDNSTNSVTLNEIPAALKRIRELVETTDDEEVIKAAKDLEDTFPDKKGMLERAATLVSLISGSVGLMRDVTPHLHLVYEVLSRLA